MVQMLNQTSTTIGAIFNKQGMQFSCQVAVVTLATITPSEKPSIDSIPNNLQLFLHTYTF